MPDQQSGRFGVFEMFTSIGMPADIQLIERHSGTIPASGLNPNRYCSHGSKYISRAPGIWLRQNLYSKIYGLSWTYASHRHSKLLLRLETQSMP